TRFSRDWSSDVCSSDLPSILDAFREGEGAQVEAALKAAADNRSDIQPLELRTAGENGGSVRLWVTPVGDTAAEGETAILYALDKIGRASCRERGEISAG